MGVTAAYDKFYFEMTYLSDPNLIVILRYESSTLILYKELSSTIFQSCQSVSQASITPVQISTLCNKGIDALY